MSNAQMKSGLSVIVSLAAVLTAAVAVWPSTITRMASSDFLPHGFCYLWDKHLLTLHVVSDSLIFLSYVAISYTIAHLLYHERRRLPFEWIFVAFGIFIVACGFTHAMDVVVLWIPLYWLAGDIKLVTAIASVTTAIALPILVPKIRLILKQAASSRLNELRFVGAAENSMDCLYLVDAVRDANGEIEDFVFTYVNACAVNLVTFSKEELIGGRMSEMFPLNRKIGLLDKYKDVVRSGESFVGEFAIQEDNIRTAWLRIQASRLGEGVAIAASDITARKEQEEGIRKSEALLARTERLTNTGGWEIDLATSEVFWSPEVRRIQGVAPDYQPTLDEAIEFYIPEDRLRIRDVIQAATSDGNGFDLECTVVRADGRQVPVRVLGGAQYENGKPIRLAGAFQDITQQVAERVALTTVKDRLSLATDSGGIGIWDWDIAKNTLCWDRWMYRLYGMEPREDDEVYELWRQHVHPEDRDSAERQLRDAMNGVKPFHTVFRILWGDGSVHYIQATALAINDESGRPARMIGTNTDVTAQKENELEVAKLAGFMHSIISSSPFATIVTDLQGVITSVNPAAERMLWYGRQDLVHRETPMLLLSPQQVVNRASVLSEELHSIVEPGIDVLTANPRRGKLEEAEWELIRRDGSRFDAQLTVSALTDETSGIVGYILVAYDITERKRAQDYIAHLARHDELTGLPTRALFRDRLDAALARATRYQRKVGVLMVDLDNFKKVNDFMGHHVGDELLVVMAKRLQSCARGSDMVARMGGDEFTLVLDELRSAEDAELVAEKIVQAITMPVPIGPHIISPTASIGISVYPDGGSTAQALLTNADVAMYRAKAEGRNARRTYTSELARAESRARELEEGLSHALALHEFELVYQPQICIATGMVTGVEALLRWRSGRLGLVMPDEFISLAEENGMIVRIGEWVLRTACRQGRQLQVDLDRPLTIAVNISPRQFRQNDLPQMIENILEESKLSPSSLELEITENVLIGDLPRPKAILEEIRALGVRVAIDDFGTGFSSMSYILRFRVDRLKIDRSFIRKMEVDPDSHVVTNAVIALAKGLHIPVVAEGVESDVHRDLLLRQGCDDAQGYFYSKPLPMEDVPDAIHAIEHPELQRV
jgi:diguanylate cyclase (GGDEF)-like protein/PAS domain S-box-containing protein